MCCMFVCESCLICWPPGAVLDSFAAPVDVVAEFIIGNCAGGYVYRSAAVVNLVASVAIYAQDFFPVSL